MRFWWSRASWVDWVMVGPPNAGCLGLPELISLCIWWLEIGLERNGPARPHDVGANILSV